MEFDWCRCYCFISSCIYHTIHRDRNFLRHFEVKFWNYLTIISCHLNNGRIVLCLDLILWFVGTLHLFAAFQRLGPKLAMIFNTVCSFVLFLPLPIFSFCPSRWKISSLLFALLSFSYAPFRSHHGRWLILHQKSSGSIVVMENCIMWRWL